MASFTTEDLRCIKGLLVAKVTLEVSGSSLAQLLILLTRRLTTLLHLKAAVKCLLPTGEGVTLVPQVSQFTAWSRQWGKGSGGQPEGTEPGDRTSSVGATHETLESNREAK